MGNRGRSVRGSTSRFALFVCAAFVLTSCSAGGGGGGGAIGVTVPASPTSISATAGDGTVTVTWSAVSGATSYTLYWSTTSGVGPGHGTPIALVTSPRAHQGLANGLGHFYVITASNSAGESAPSVEVSATPQSAGSAYDPPWASVAPTQTIPFDHVPSASDQVNGANLKAAIQGLTPGQRLEVGAGTYSINSFFAANLVGTAAAPIWVAAKSGETPVITRPDAAQNLMNVGSGGPARYLSFEGLEFTGGSSGIRLYNCRNVRLDGLHIHHVGENGITANTANTAFLYITRNHIHDTAGYAEAMYLGANNSLWVMRNSIIALNHVHDTYGIQGDGIEIKQGSYDNWIVENLVHDTNYPCILVYGTDGNAPNVIERNICYNSNDNVMQIQGEAIVRNNLIMNGAVGFSSHDHQAQSRDLTFVHNTIVNSGRGANLSAWNNRPGMVFANNVVYSQSSDAIRFANGSNGVDVVGNVVRGPVVGASSGFVSGAGLSDFTSVTWNASQRDATPTGSSAIIGAGDMMWEVPEDLTGATRSLPLDAGCYDGP